MLVLIGFSSESEYGYGGYTGRTLDIETPLAVFDTNAKADAYVEWSKKAGGFKDKSLLAGYDDYDMIEIDFNPTYGENNGKTEASQDQKA